MRTAFYCVADARYFLGAVGMINSLRLQGHEEPVFVLDCGLTASQRRILGNAAELIDAPSDAAPHLLKTVAPLAAPAEVMVLVDADVVFCRPLGELIDSARDGRVVAFENHEDRWVPEWEELLGLGRIERRRYLCSALVAAGRDPGERVLRAMDASAGRAEYERSFWAVNVLEEGIPDYPFLYLDQDIFNAALGALVAAERVEAVERPLMGLTPFDGIRIEDERTLSCAYADGTRPFLLHHILPGKPWLEPVPEAIYARLLRRLLNSADVAIRPPAAAIPLRMRDGALAAIERRRSETWLRARMAAGAWRARLAARVGPGSPTGAAR